MNISSLVYPLAPLISARRAISARIEWFVLGKPFNLLLPLLFAALALMPQEVLAQSVALSPPTLSSVPKGATASNPYWQHVVITLSRNPSAGNQIVVNLPSGISIADRDGDGLYDDEVALDDSSATGTGYNSAAGTSASQIVLESGTGGVAGQVHLHFPIITPASPADSSTVYGQITFTNTGEQPISAGSLTLNLVEPRNLSLATFSRLFIESATDTTTNAQGDAYPSTVAAAFALPLPDLVSDLRGNLGSNSLSLAAVPFSDGSDSNDVSYAFWFSKSDVLAAVDTSVAVRAVNALSQVVIRANEGDSLSVAFDVSALQDTTYFLYMTSDLTGNFPLMRSRGIGVRHLPVVLSVGQFRSNDADFLDSGLLLNLDKGLADRADSARARLDILFTAVDFDDSASVRLFYATADTLDTTFVQTTGIAPNRVIASLTNAIHVDSTATLFEGRDTQLNWRVITSDSTFVARGDYYIYAAITDGKEVGIKRSDYTYNVRHSPFLALDSRKNRTIYTGGARGERYYAITWNRDNGKDGDIALTDSATIALYYSASDSFAVPNGADALVAAAADSTLDTHLIVSGLQEQPDGRADNQYIWDLWSFKNADGGGTPLEDVSYSLYGIVQTDSTRRLVRWNDESAQPRTLNFVHRPYLRIDTPLSTLDVDGRRSFEVAWEAVDVDDSAGLWILLTSAQTSLGDSTTFAAIAADSSSDWVANSTDGSLLAATAISEDSTSAFSVRPSRLQKTRDALATPIADGDYYIYVVIDEKGGATPADSSLAQRAPGLVRISGLGSAGAGGLAVPVIEMLPAELTLGAFGDTALVELRPHSGGTGIDLLSFFASVDTAFFSVVDQDTSSEGIQPFKLNPILNGIALRDTLLVGADSLTAGKWLLDLVYFEQNDNSAFDGELILATMQLVTKDTVGTTTIDIDHLGNRQSAFYRDGAVVALLPPEMGLRARIRPRGSIAGKVRLQGRVDHTSLVTLFLRDRNSFVPIDDSLFLARNDADSTRVGVQDTLAVDGSFALVQVPAGSYQLAVHVDGFLDGQYPALQVDLGVALTQIDPTFLDDGQTDPGFLFGGDVTGYIDSSSSAIPDNEIDQLDIDFVVAHFAQTISATHVGRLADIDGDSLVWVGDLNIVASNFNVAGVEPVFKRAVVASDPVQAAAVWRLNEREEAGRLIVDVFAEGLSGARAYAFRLRYHGEQLRLQRVDERAFAGRPTVLARRQTDGELAWGAALSGAQGGVSGEQLLASLLFERLAAGPTAVQLLNAQWVDATHIVHGAQAEGIRPRSFALWPNYPNPFNPRTQLRFQIPEATQVRLDIYDAVGQRVRSLVHELLPVGLHAVTWDGRDDGERSVASGAYFARLHVGERIAVRKMLLLR